MTFSMRYFIKNGFLKAVGKMGDYWVILNAAGWFDKGVLLQEDLVEIQSAINAHNIETAASMPETVPPTESPSDVEAAPAEIPSDDEPETPAESLSGDESETPSGDAATENM